MNQVEFDLDFPEGVVRFAYENRPDPRLLWQLTREMIPIADTITGLGHNIAKQFGLSVSCKKGCGVCCCQMAPLSPPETAIIADVVDHLPQARQSEVRRKFSRALETLARAGIQDVVSDMYATGADKATVLEINRAYFELRIPCPFLTEGSCGIYEHRPSRCREYSVMSDPEYCADPFDEHVRRLPLTLKLCEAFSYGWSALCGKPPLIIPLIKSLAWVRANPEIRDLRVDSSEHVVRTILEFACAKANDSAAKKAAR